MKGHLLQLEHFPLSLLPVVSIKKTTTSGGATGKPPIVLYHYIHIKTQKIFTKGVVSSSERSKISTNQVVDSGKS